MPTALPELAGVTHRFVDLPGLRMHVAEAGAGEPVLLLHGFPQHWWEWRKIIPGLAEHHRVICPDLRGAGWTDAPAGGYDREQLGADLVNLLDALALDRVGLLAHDWGAIVGFGLCLDHPDRVRGLLALGVPHPYLRFDPGLLRSMWRIWFQLAIAAPGVGAPLLSRGRQSLARHLLTAYVSDPAVWTEEELATFLGPLREPARARAAGALYRGLILPEPGRILRGAYRGTRLRVPTRLLVGADDPVIRPELLGGSEAYADNLTVEVVDGAAHFLADERPDAVLASARRHFAV